MLTNAAVKAARPKARAYKIFDERGLHLYIAPTGLRAWRMKYRFAGREKLLSIGHFPMLTLDEARAVAIGAREQLGRGEDPAVATSDQVAEIKRFESVARAWHADRRPRWTDRHASDVLASLERDVFPAIGAMAIATIDAAELLALIQSIEARGAHETARRVRQRLDMIFSYAAVRKLVDSNPAAAIAGELQAAPAPRRQPALTELADARALLAAAELIDVPPVVKLASRYLALTAVRIGALLGAEWGEFEDLDGDAPLWRVPAARMKLKKAKKADQANDHLVPLSAAAVQLLYQVREHVPDGGNMVFPISAGAIGALYARAGYAGRHVPHGWRATFSTILNEAMPDEQAAIDRALGHVGLGKVEAAYNRAAQLARRRALFDRWGAMLTT